MLTARVVVELIQRMMFFLCQATVTLHQGQGHRNQYEDIYAIYNSTFMPNVNAIF